VLLTDPRIGKLKDDMGPTNNSLLSGHTIFAVLIKIS